jgi:hypothetical protein
MCRVIVSSVEYLNGILAFLGKVAEEFTEAGLILFLQLRSGRHLDTSVTGTMIIGGSKELTMRW